MTGQLSLLYDAKLFTSLLSLSFSLRFCETIHTVITHTIYYKPDGLKILSWLLNTGLLNLDWLVLVGLSTILHVNYTPSNNVKIFLFLLDLFQFDIVYSLWLSPSQDFQSVK